MNLVLKQSEGQELQDLIRDSVHCDGAHHKQWYLEMIAGILEVELEEHERGIAP